MSNLTTEHLGYEIQFREDPEQWECSDLRMEAKSLKALKAKMSKADAAARQVSVPCAFFEGSYATKPRRGTITMIAKDADRETERVSLPNFRSETVRHPTVWIVAGKQGSRSNQSERKKCRVSELLDLTNPITEDLLREYQALDEQARELANRAKAVRAKIPRMTIEQIMAHGVAEDDDQ